MSLIPLETDGCTGRCSFANWPRGESGRLCMNGCEMFVFNLAAICSHPLLERGYSVKIAELPSCGLAALIFLTAFSGVASADGTVNPANPDASTSQSQTSTIPGPEGEHKSAHGRPSIYLGPEVGVYLPVSARTRNRFGTGWLDYGPSLGSIYTARDGGAITPDIHILGRTSGADKVLFVLAGVEYRKALISLPRVETTTKGGSGKEAPQVPIALKPLPVWIPYAGASFDIVVGDALSYEDNVHSGIRQGLGGSVFSGVTYRNRAYIEARFIGTSTIKSFDLSGFSINVGLRFRL